MRIMPVMLGAGLQAVKVRRPCTILTCCMHDGVITGYTTTSNTLHQLVHILLAAGEYVERQRTLPITFLVPFSYNQGPKVYPKSTIVGDAQTKTMILTIFSLNNLPK